MNDAMCVGGSGAEDDHLVWAFPRPPRCGEASSDLIRNKVDQAFNAENYQQIMQHGMMLHMDLDSPPGNNQLRLAVQDKTARELWVRFSLQ